MKEVKRFRLLPGRKPQEHPLLSGVVRVCDSTGIGTANIKFTEHFVDAVGKALPSGLTPSDPAYLKLIYMPGDKVWRLWAMYLKTERGVVLWDMEALPAWVAKVNRR